MLKKILMFLLCFLVTVFALFFSGFPNLVDDLSESLAIATFLGISVLLTVIVFAITEMFLKIKQLTERLNKLEEKQNR